MKTKFAVFTLSLLMVLTMAPDAFAQESVTFQVSSGATVGRMNGHTEMAGGITLARITGGLTDNDVMTMTLMDRWLSITASRSRMQSMPVQQPSMILILRWLSVTLLIPLLLHLVLPKMRQ